MTQSSSQAHAFYRDVAKSRVLWTVCDDVGFPQPKTSDGHRAQPFWSSLPRVQRIIREVPAYGSFEPHELTWEQFEQDWVPDLEETGVRVGVNWSGKRATGYDLHPREVLRNVSAAAEATPTQASEAAKKAKQRKPTKKEPTRKKPR